MDSVVREAHVTGRALKAPLPVEVIVPEPSVRLPFHVTYAVLSTAIVLVSYLLFGLDFVCLVQGSE